MIERWLYDNSVRVWRDDAHCYHVSTTDAKPDGVTTILGLIPKYLLPWVARTTSEYIKTKLLERMARGDTIAELSYIESLCEEAKRAHTVKRDTAGDIGSEVHAFAEEMIHLWGDEDFEEHAEALMPTNPAAKAAADAFLVWLANTRMKPIATERVVFSKRLFYAGTCDVFAEINGLPTVIDFKTGSGFYEDQPLQLAAYALALEEELGIEIPHGWIIHLDKQTGKMTPYHVEITPELKTDWEAVRIAWRAVKRNQDRHKAIRRDSKWKAPQSTNTTQAAAAP